LFFFFELFLGKQLPSVLTFALPGIAIACLVSAWTEMNLCRLELQLESLREVIRLARPADELR
jgi:hypothetical protein